MPTPKAQVQSRLSFETVFEDDTVRISTHRQRITESDVVLLSFTGIGHAMGVINVQRPEFVGTGLRMGRVILISDLQRSWGNALDFSRIRAVLEPYIKGHRVLGIGNSMGGFLSVVASNHLPIETSVSFAAQFSVSPKLMPDERRYLKFVSEIETFRIPSLAGQFNDRTRYYMFFGDAPIEARHWSRIDRHPGLTRIVLSNQGHAVADRLKAAGLLDPVINACFEHRLTPTWLQEAVKDASVSGDDPVILGMPDLGAS